MRKVFFIFLLLLPSCTIGPDYQEKNVFENTQIAQSLQLKSTGLKISDIWYLDFKDDNLNTLIAKALNSNTDVLSAIEKLRQARTLYKIAEVQYLPMLNASSGYDYTKASKNIGPSADTDYYSLGFDASWEVDIWGKGRRLNEQKKAEFDSAYYSLQNIKNVITAEVANTYFTLKTLEAQKNIALHNLKLQQDIFKTLQEKYNSGITDESAYRQSAYLVQKTKSLIPALETQIQAQKNALAVLTGNLPNTIDSLLQTPKNPIDKAYHYHIKNLTDLPADIIRTRPDVKAAEKAMVSQNAVIGQAVAALYPSISLSTLFAFQATNMSDLIKSSSQAYAYNPSAVLPIFHWGALQNAVNLEKEKMAEVYQNYRKTLLTSVEELSNAIFALKNEYQTNRAARNGAYNMEKAYLAMKEKYDSGLIEYASLLETQQDLLQAQTALAKSNGAIYTKIIAFYKATGGGYNAISDSYD